MEILLRKKNFQKIVCFYLFECPVLFSNGRKVSERGRTFKDRKLDKNGLNSLVAAMRRCSNISIYTVKQTPTVPTGVQEYLIIRERSDMSIVNAYYYSIRNALAHGSFQFENGYLSFENKHNGDLKALGRIKDSTLLRWIELCDMRVSDLKTAR